MLCINVLILVKTALHIRNWRNVKVQVRVLQLHKAVFSVILGYEQLLPNLLKKVEVEHRKIDL